MSCVERDVHRIAICLLLVAGTARAEGDDFVAAPGHAVSLGAVAHASRLGAASESGMGGDLEGALGSDRTQYFGELALAHATIDAMTGTSAGASGYLGRAGFGVRWLARQFQPERGGGIELFVEAVTGVERYWWVDGGRLTRPDLGVGIGMQMRAWKFHGLTLRLGSRVMFAPTDRESSLVICRGTGCPMGASTSVAGFTTGMVIAW